MKEIKEMRIGSGKEMKDGKKTKINGYAPKVGRSLCELLKTEGLVKMVALGDAPGNIALKAMAHAQALLKLEGKNLNVIEIGFQPVTLTREDSEPLLGKAVFVQIELVIE